MEREERGRERASRAVEREGGGRREGGQFEQFIFVFHFHFGVGEFYDLPPSRGLLSVCDSDWTHWQHTVTVTPRSPPSSTSSCSSPFCVIRILTVLSALSLNTVNRK